MISNWISQKGARESQAVGDPLGLTSRYAVQPPPSCLIVDCASHSLVVALLTCSQLLDT